MTRWPAILPWALAFALALGGCSLEDLLNRRTGAVPVVADARASRVHASSLVVDLHADSLLWGRDLARRSARGHADLPRLREGNVAIQFFTIVTHVPMTVNIHRTDERWPDLISALAWLHDWPAPTRRSRLERAVWQVSRLEELSARAPGLRVLRSREDLELFLAERSRDPGVIGAVLGLEGAHALEGDPANLETFADRGVRMIGLTHFFDNAFAGSAHGRFRGGLTDAGRDLLQRMERRGVLVDLAHASPDTIRDALAITTRPPVVSHTGVRGTCDNPRNLSDEQLRAIADADGVIGIGFWETAVCGDTTADVARAIRHAVAVVGDRHVALGSDFDGAVATPFDASGLSGLTAELLTQNLSERSVRRILGGNVLRLLRATLP